MTTKQNNWLKNPSTKQILILSVIYIISISLVILATSDLFRVSIFERKNLLLFASAIGATITTCKAHLNYWNQKKASKVNP